MDLSLKKPAKPIKFLKKPQAKLQASFLKSVGLLLKEGFSLKEALNYLERVSTGEIKSWAVESQKMMMEGLAFYQIIEKLDFSKQIVSQLFFANQNGRHHETVYECGVQYFKTIEKKRKFMQLLTYPIILIVFALGMLLGIRFILLPHIEKMTSQVENAAFGLRPVLFFVKFTPYFLVFFLLTGLVLTISFKGYFKNKSPLRKATFLGSLPVGGKLFQLYHSQFLALEWGYLFTGGSSQLEVTHLMTENKSYPLLQALGFFLKEEMIQGKSMALAISNIKFVKDEIADIIDHGQMSGKLGMELNFFAHQCEEELSEKVERLMALIQPIIFIGIAIIIITVYLAILLPTFSIMGDL